MGANKGAVTEQGVRPRLPDGAKDGGSAMFSRPRLELGFSLPLHRNFL